MAKYEDQYEWKGTRTDRKSPREEHKKKKANAFNIVLYCIAGILIVTGAVILFREMVYIPTDETHGLISEEEFNENQTYEETKPKEALAEPVDDYDLIPVQFHFIDRGASCDVYPTGVEDDGSMGTVSSAKDVTWLSVRPYVEPGAVGNSVISGHNLWKGEAGTFSLLHKIQLGEQVAVTFDKGFTRYFEVTEIYECRYNDTTPMKTDVNEPILTLITCKGNWSDSLQQSKDRIVAVCKPVQN